MPWLVHLVAPGFAADGKDLLIQTSRLMLLSPLGFGLSIAIGCALQGRHRFLTYALSPVVYNLTIILSIVWLAPHYGVVGVVGGVAIGAFVHAGVRLLELLRTGFRPQPHRPWKEPALAETVRLMLPRVAGLLAVQANLWIYNALASTLGEGNISIFNFARNFQSLPVSLFGIALATVLFPRLAEHFAHDRPQDIVTLGQRAVTQLLFLTVPAMVGMMLVSHPLVKLLLGSGEFTDTAVTTTSLALMVFALSIPLESIQHILARIFYAQHNVNTPVKIALVGAFINAVVCVVAMQWLGVYGLAFGFVVTALSQVVLLQRALRKTNQSILTSQVLMASSKIIIASTVMGLVVFVLLWFIQPALLRLLLAVGVGLLVYAGCAHGLHIPEFRDTVDMIKTVWQGKVQPNLNVLFKLRRRS
jgi:putative peptidoglycan lipid II flippase